MRVAVLLPTRGRVQQAVNCIDRLLDTAPVDVFLVTEDPAEKFLGLPDQAGVHFLSCSDGMWATQKWNMALKAAARWDAFVLGADDLVFGDGWLDETMKLVERGFGCVSFNDFVTDGNQLGTHYLMTKSFITDFNGGVMVCPHYRSWCLDVETTERAKRAGAYAWASQAMVEHRHVHFKKSSMDATYQRGYLSHQYDQMILAVRQRAGWPDDFERVIA